MHANVRRSIVRGFYPGPAWRARVMAMTDEEVERMHEAKLAYDQEQLQEKAENDEVHPNGAQS